MYRKELISDYSVVDVETTGLSAYYDDIIEIAILKVRNDVVIEQYSQLINPNYPIPSFVSELTGITDDMLKGMPSVLDVKDDVIKFIGSDIVLGHNTSFDVKFLEQNFGISPDYIDTMQFSRKLFPELPHHRLKDMTKYLNLTNNTHRAFADCIATKDLYDAIKEKMLNENLDIKDLWKSYHSKGIDISSIVPESVEIDEDGFFYNKHVVFTGKLEKMVRKDAMQLVVNLGGILDSSVNKDTNYLILGNNDYNPILRGEKSSKHKKAEALKLKGQDIDVIDELTFYDLLNL